MSLENKQSVYNDWPIGIKEIDKYKPEFLARGGEHLVYTIPEHPNVVVKASWHKIKDILHHAYTKDFVMTENEIKSYVEENYKEDILKKNLEAGNLQEYFGSKHTLTERRYLMSVPITQEILQRLFQDDYLGRELSENTKNISSVWTHISIQKFTKEAQNPNRLSLCFGGYPEWYPVNLNEYEEITNSLVSGESDKISVGKFLEFQDLSKEKYLSKLVENTSVDESIKDTLIDFIKLAIKYTKEKGQTLALAGEDNVIFYKENSAWTYLLIDAIPIPTEPIYKRAEEIIFNAGDSIIESDKATIFRCLNYVRVINGVAMALNVPDRLSMPKISHDQFLSILKSQ